MVFELYKKIRFNNLLSDNIISVRKEAIYFGQNVGDDLKSSGWVVILIDKDNRKIAIQSSERSQNAFRLLNRHVKAGKYYICCKNVVRNINPNQYKTVKENNMWVFKYEDEKDENHD